MTPSQNPKSESSWALGNIQSAVVEDWNTNSDGNTHTHTFCEVLIWGWHLTRNHQFRPHLGDLTSGRQFSRITWKYLPEMWERLVSLLLNCLFANYISTHYFLKDIGKWHPLGCINLCRRNGIIFLPSQTFQYNIWQPRSGAVQTFIKTF